MKKSIVLLLVLISTFSFGQNNGFLGKKNFISAEVRVFTPLLYGLFSLDESQYKNDGSSFIASKNYVDYGFNFSYGRALSRNVGFIFQYGISYYDFSYSRDIGYVKNPNYTIDDFYDNYSDYLKKSNWFKGKSTTFMPIIEMTNGSGLLPLGLTHQLGIGFTKHQFIEDNYNIQFQQNDGLKNYTPKNLFNYERNFTRSYTMMYKVNLRVPITEFLLFNVGIRYNLNIVPGSNSFYNHNSGNYLISEFQFHEMVKTKEFSNIMSFETGFSFCF